MFRFTLPPNCRTGCQDARVHPAGRAVGVSGCEKQRPSRYRSTRSRHCSTQPQCAWRARHRLLCLRVCCPVGVRQYFQRLRRALVLVVPAFFWARRKSFAQCITVGADTSRALQTARMACRWRCTKAVPAACPSRCACSCHLPWRLACSMHATPK